MADKQIFIKTNGVDFLKCFESEFFCLKSIEKTKTIICPHPLFYGATSQFSYLVMSYLGDIGEPTAEAGSLLARMHSASASERFGYPIATYCGPTLLDNTLTDEPWSQWFVRHRLEPMLRSTEIARVGNLSIMKVCERIIKLLEDHDKDAVPCLLHGDLWFGNCGSVTEGPCIFDPACYFGDKEVDLAATALFGGFPDEFYAAYQDISPISPGFDTRKTIYNLFHLLNHYVIYKNRSFLTEALSDLRGLLLL